MLPPDDPRELRRHARNIGRQERREQEEAFRLAQARKRYEAQAALSGTSTLPPPGTPSLFAESEPTPAQPATPEQEGRAVRRWFSGQPLTPVLPQGQFVERPLTESERSLAHKINQVTNLYRELYPQLSPPQIADLVRRHYAQYFPGNMPPESMILGSSGIASGTSYHTYRNFNETSFDYFYGSNPLADAYRYILTLRADDFVVVHVYGVFTTEAVNLYRWYVDEQGNHWGWASMGPTRLAATLARGFILRAMDMRNRFSHIQRVRVWVLKPPQERGL
jgi:hypothetical protein